MPEFGTRPGRTVVGRRQGGRVACRRAALVAMPITALDLNRATLARQLLLRRERLEVVDAVARVVAIQAQEPASPYIALWNRVDGFDPAALDRAFADRAIVKGTSLRMTLHALHAADYPPFHEAMQPSLRAARLGDSRFRVAGLSAAEADALIGEVLAFAAEPRTNAEMEAWFDERLGVLPRPGVWWALRTYAPVVHAPVGGPWSFGPRPVYRAARDPRHPGDIAASLRHLVRRYLEGFGPATIADIGQFAHIERARARTAVEELGDELVRLEGPGGTPLFDVPGGARPEGDTPAPPRLLPMWDSTLLAYADRGRVLPAELRRHVTRVNGDVLPTLLVDGHVAGVWRPADGGIEATAFHPLPDEAWAGLEAEARDLVAFLATRDPAVYRRYANWWAKLPPGEVRVLAG